MVILKLRKWRSEIMSVEIKAIYKITIKGTEVELTLEELRELYNSIWPILKPRIELEKKSDPREVKAKELLESGYVRGRRSRYNFRAPDGTIIYLDVNAVPGTKISLKRVNYIKSMLNKKGRITPEEYSKRFKTSLGASRASIRTFAGCYHDLYQLRWEGDTLINLEFGASERMKKISNTLSKDRLERIKAMREA